MRLRCHNAARLRASHGYIAGTEDTPPDSGGACASIQSPVEPLQPSGGVVRDAAVDIHLAYCSVLYLVWPIRKYLHSTSAECTPRRTL